MKNLRQKTLGLVVFVAVFTISGLVGVNPAFGSPFSFSTGDPNGLIGTLSRPASAGKLQTETADDFILDQAISINHATFTGLLPSGTPLTAISQVEIEFYRVFPNDSNVGRTSGPPTFSTTQVPTRFNSPADVEITSATRDSIVGSLSFTAFLLAPSFSVLNTVVNGIHPMPGQFTGGEGPTTGEEVLIDVTFNTPIVLVADHYFFRPEVELSSGDFLWLSAPKPIVGGTGPFSPDLQSWIRNDNLAPDWLRIGTDITHQGPFNSAFSLSGETVPEPATMLLLGSGLLGLAGYARKKFFKK